MLRNNRNEPFKALSYYMLFILRQKESRLKFLLAWWGFRVTRYINSNKHKLLSPHEVPR